MSKPNSIAVIVSTYNSIADLGLVVASYALQTDQSFCLYIADDGSTQETADCIAKLQQSMPFSIQHVYHPDKGFRLAKIRNKAIVECKEDYVLITDGDCIAPSGLIAAHRKLACPDHFVTGSRLLLQQRFSQQLRQQTAQLADNIQLRNLFKQRLQKQINRLWPLLLPPSLNKASAKLSGLRGCHMAFWRQDLITVHGYDEQYQGWGREDSDLAARLFHAGIKRRHLRGMPLLHLWHHEAKRDGLNRNDVLLTACLAERRIQAIQGIHSDA